VTAGLAATTLANNWLNMLRGTAFTAPAAEYVKLHIGDPGAAAATNPSAVTTRVVVTHAAASAGSISLTGTPPSWTMTATETITHISVWDASSAGNFLYSAALTASKAVVNTDTLTLNTLTVSLTPIAA
jgi:hypothetical protein